jgi:glycosyltransferase involved in cell wall biosynthesis
MAPDDSVAERPSVPPTLVFIVPALARGGMLSVMQGIWEHLPGQRIVIVTQEHSTLSVPHHTVLLRRAFGDPLRFPGAWVYTWRVARAAARIARDAPGEVLLVPQDALATGAGAVLAGRRTRTPVVVMDHGSAMVYRTKFFWRERISRSRLHERIREPLLRASLRILHRLARGGADRVLLPSREAVDCFAADGVPRERIARYHVPLNLARLHPLDPDRRMAIRDRLGVPEGAVLALSVSRLTPEKGLDLLIDAVAQLPSERRPILAIGGSGPLRSAIEERAASRGIDVRMLGGVEPGDIADLMGASDFVAYASHQGTNTPVVILEAMACARLVVATDQPPATHDLLADGRGIVVPAGDVDRFAAALGAAISMGEAERRAAGEAARKWIEREHDPDRVAIELADGFSVRTARGPGMARGAR